MKILIIVPAFNEAANVAYTINQISSAFPSADTVVIDDGSKDNTAIVAKQAGARVLRLPFNLGIGGAVQTGFMYADKHGYDIAVQIDADGQHDPLYLPQLLGPILNDEADMVIGSRFLEDKKGFKSTFTRRIGINFFVRLINLLTKMDVSDPTSGFRAHNRKLIESFARYYPHDFPEPEAVVLASRMHVRLKEVGVVMHPRQGGVSSIRYMKSMYYMLKVTVAILLHMMHRRSKVMNERGV